MIPYTLGDHKFNIPTSYDELTIGQFFELKKVDPEDNIAFLSIISGLDKEVWTQCRDLDIASKIYPFIEWMKRPFNVELYTPDFLDVDGIKHKRPGGLGICVYGQIEHLKLIIQEIGDKPESNDFDLFPDLLAIIFQPVIDNADYNYERAMELKPSLLNCSVREAWPMCSFFLNNLTTYSTRRKSGFYTLLHRKKWERALTGLKSSDHGQQFSVWRRPLIALQKKFSFWLMTMSSRRYISKQKKDDTSKPTKN